MNLTQELFWQNRCTLSAHAKSYEDFQAVATRYIVQTHMEIIFLSQNIRLKQKQDWWWMKWKQKGIIRDISFDNWTHILLLFLSVSTFAMEHCLQTFLADFETNEVYFRYSIRWFCCKPQSVASCFDMTFFIGYLVPCCTSIFLKFAVWHTSDWSSGSTISLPHVLLEASDLLAALFF